jgi:hypothetical protein
MRKSSLILMTMTLAVLAASAAGISSANHCTGTKTSKASAHDPYGSCEDGGGVSSKGNLRCGKDHSKVDAPGTAATSAGTVTKYKVDANKGVQICSDGAGQPSGPVPVYVIQGRATVYKDANNNVLVSADGDRDNSGNIHPSAAGWNRTDVRPGASSCKVRVRRGTAEGTYWLTSAGDTSPPTTSDNCVG